MADISWFKVLTGIFEDEKIKLIQVLPEGDSILVMWFKLLAQAGKTNAGGFIYLNENTPYNMTALATIFGREESKIRYYLETLIQYGMIERFDDGKLFITNWEKHQNVASMDSIREKNRLRQAEYRKRLQTGIVQKSNDGVTLRDDVDKEEDKELEKDKYINAFDDFWKVYPSKKGVTKAKENWKKKIVPLLIKGELTIFDIVKGTEDYASYLKQSGRTPKDGSTAVNQQVWADDWTYDGIVYGNAGIVTAAQQTTNALNKALREELEQGGTQRRDITDEVCREDVQLLSSGRREDSGLGGLF